MESGICINCFAEYQRSAGSTCSVCGWDNDKEQPQGCLPYHTVLNARYHVGRAKSVNGEGVTYVAFDSVRKRVVEIREYFPSLLASRNADGSVAPFAGSEIEYERQLQEFLQLSKNVSRLRELSVIPSVLDIFEDNFTIYTVYEYEPAPTLRHFIESAGGSISWNEANRMFAPIMTALGLINSLGISHLGVSPDTLRVRKNGSLLLTGFCITSARQVGGSIKPELFSGCAAIEQYNAKGNCGETSDVYGFAATLLFALTGQVPQEAGTRLKDQRLMISKEVLHSLPPFAVTAIANALQVKQDVRTATFERFKTELSAAPTIVNEVSETDAIRRLPPIDMDLPQNKGLPPAVWLIGSCFITLIALVIVASMWLGDRGMSFGDLGALFHVESSVEEENLVPDMVNQSYDEWLAALTAGEYDFKLKVSARIFSDTMEEGHIISQSPLPQEKLHSGDTIVVTVSKGSQMRILPPIKGMTYGELQNALISNSFVAERVEEPSDEVDEGYVIRYQDHEEGETLEYGSTITLVVSSGPAVSSEASQPEESE